MQVGLNNRVLKNLSQSSSKAAVDLLGMRLSTTIKDNFVEILITETEAYGRKNTDPMSCLLYTSPSPRDKRQSRMPSSA